MTHNPHHEHLIQEINQLFKPILTKSPQAIYIYLDDEHKICNKKFATLLGYKTEQEWIDNPYPVDDLDPKDQKKGIETYIQTSEKLIASTVEGTWITKQGKKIHSTILMTPFVYKDEVFVLHFISPK